MVNPQSRQTEQYALQARCRFREIKCAVPTLEKTCTITARFYSTWNVFCPNWNGNLVMAAMSVPNSAPRMAVVWHAIVWAWERYLSETDSESCKTQTLAHTHTHKHTRLTSFFPGLHGSAGTRKVKPIWILLKQEAVSGSGITWTICKSAPRSRQITTPTPHRSVFYRPNPFLPLNQQRQSTEGNQSVTNIRPKVSELTNTKHLQCQACDKYNIIGKVT